jgi:hypothetical protein
MNLSPFIPLSFPRKGGGIKRRGFAPSNYPFLRETSSSNGHINELRVH